MKYFTLDRQVPSGRPNRQLVLQAADEFIQNGALGIRGAFSKELIQELQEVFVRQTGISEEKRDAGCRKVGHMRYMSAVRVEHPFNTPELYANRAVLAVIKTLLGKLCKLDSIGAVCAYPGSQLQHIHRDHSSLFQDEEICTRLPPYAITVVVPLVNVDMETGPTAIWKGSHRMLDAHDYMKRLNKQPDLSGASFPLTNMGDCYLMDYRLIHSGMPNRSSQTRSILYNVYSRPWFHDAIGYDGLPPMIIDKAEYEKIPEKHKDLFVGTVPNH